MSGRNEFLDLIYNSAADIRDNFNPAEYKQKDAVTIVIKTLEGTDYALASLTVYDSKAVKNSRTLPLTKFISLVGEIEETLGKVGSAKWHSQVWGFKPPKLISQLLFSKKVHRVFVLRKEHIVDFSTELNNVERFQNRLQKNKIRLIINFTN